MSFIEIVQALIKIEVSLPPKENSLSDLLLKKLGLIEISKGFSLLVEEPACLKMSFEGVAREHAANILHQNIKNELEDEVSDIFTKKGYSGERSEFIVSGRGVEFLLDILTSSDQGECTIKHRRASTPSTLPTIHE